MFKLFSQPTHAKIKKSNATGEYLTGILHLAPASISGHNVCPWSTEGCRQACLNSAGRGRFDNVQQARIRKTKLFFDDRKMFFDILIKEIEALIKKCAKEGVLPAVRLNGTSDITWEKIPVNGAKNIFALFPEVQFYDYTKASFEKRAPEIANYHLVYSRANSAQKGDLVRALSQGRNVAVVFNGDLPKYYWGYPVVNGDETDLRFLDPKGCIIGLSAKGAAKKSIDEFIVQVA